MIDRTTKNFTTEAQRAQRFIIFRLPGDDGKRKESPLKDRKHHSSTRNAIITKDIVFFAHCRLPMGKKKKNLCVLCASVVKKSEIHCIKCDL